MFGLFVVSTSSLSHIQNHIFSFSFSFSSAPSLLHFLLLCSRSLLLFHSVPPPHLPLQVPVFLPPPPPLPSLLLLIFSSPLSPLPPSLPPSWPRSPGPSRGPLLAARPLGAAAAASLPDMPFRAWETAGQTFWLHCHCLLGRSAPHTRRWISIRIPRMPRGLRASSSLHPLPVFSFIFIFLFFII